MYKNIYNKKKQKYQWVYLNLMYNETQTKTKQKNSGVLHLMRECLEERMSTLKQKQKTWAPPAWKGRKRSINVARTVNMVF